MGCRGVPTLGMRQPRGGDRLTHLHDRFAPLAAVRGVVGTMNVENDLADALVTNDAAGGDVLLARADQLVTDARAVGSPIVLYKQPNTNTAIGSKAAAVTRFNSQIDSRAASDVWIFDQSAFFNPQDANDSGDGIHPTKAASAVRLGNGLGDLLASKFVSAGIFDAGGQLAGNFHTGWNMGVAGSVSNGSGCTVTESADFLRSQPSVPCRKLSISGTCTADPTSGASTGDIRLRFASPHAGGTNTIGKSVTAYCLIEITDSAGNDQQKLASLLFQAAQSSAFSKTFVPANGPWHDGKKYVGVFGIMPSLITAQSLTCNIDFIFRPLQEAGVDIEVRIAYLNCLYTDDVAYGPATNASASSPRGDQRCSPCRPRRRPPALSLSAGHSPSTASRASSGAASRAPMTRSAMDRWTLETWRPRPLPGQRCRTRSSPGTAVRRWPVATTPRTVSAAGRAITFRALR